MEDHTPLTHVVYHVLLSLARERRHGYGIIKDVSERTGGRLELEAGTLYAAVKRLRDDGWIEEVRAPTGAASRRRYYAITPAPAVVLLIGAGLLFRSFALLLDKDLGFDPSDRVALQVFAYDYPSAGARANFVNGALQNIRAIPGVERVALTTSVPGATDATISAIAIDVPFLIEGRDVPPAGQEPIAWTSSVSPGYFDVS